MAMQTNHQPQRRENGHSQLYISLFLLCYSCWTHLIHFQISLVESVFIKGNLSHGRGGQGQEGKDSKQFHCGNGGYVWMCGCKRKLNTVEWKGMVSL
jgi:hypothetical protein